MANMYGMTDLGKARYELVLRYNLDDFYQLHNGNVIIPNEAFREPVSRCVMVFLKDNPKWVLGHEENYWYLTTLADIKEA